MQHPHLFLKFCPATGEMKQGESSVREYNTMFLAGGLVDKHDEPTLVKKYREGLRENIRSKIETTWSFPNPVEGSDDESDSKVDLEDYKEYIEEKHKSDSESSEDSK
ncbi:unnamed protein product [Brassica oleracea]